ncbi:hypothetical protein D210916BOD24_08600 [Alteromonas sp. D210916BOD_24]|uniref:hypothetical protein n=1 Tax=Alteromonas sp. D210916BOD_24 TaxID=3157618 RepID=UPI00399D2B50
MLTLFTLLNAFSTSMVGSVIRRIISSTTGVIHGIPGVIGVTLLWLGLTHSYALASSVQPNLIQHRIAVFSTYPSASLAAMCTAHGDGDTSAGCIEDALSPSAFINALQRSGKFSNLLPFSEGNDYELLIANIGESRDSASIQYGEFTLRWRGLEIDTASFSVLPESPDAEHIARSLVSFWLQHIEDKNVFTSQFLYLALNASNYENSLLVPDEVGEFIKLETQLFADPFNGAITRYTHPSFEDAFVDVTVYPFLGPLDAEENTLLNQQLNEDVEKANSVAQSQHLTLSLSSPASKYIVNSEIHGWRLGLKAESDTAPTIYATTYVFRREDKIVKVATTFPADFSDALVNEIITRVQVPQESALMKNIRAILAESTTQ